MYKDRVRIKIKSFDLCELVALISLLTFWFFSFLGNVSFPLVQNQYFPILFLSEPGAFYITTSVTNKLLMRCGFFTGVPSWNYLIVATTTTLWTAASAESSLISNHVCSLFPTMTIHDAGRTVLTGRWAMRVSQCLVSGRMGGSHTAKIHHTLAGQATWESSSHPRKPLVQSQRSCPKLLSFSAPKCKCL